MLISLYRGLTSLAGPVVRHYLSLREQRGKEDAARRGERLGRPLLARPDGPLVWIHGASVGEANSALILIDRLLAADPRVTVLLTTGTVTSARVMADRLPPRAIHQYVPIDLPGAVCGFLDHWCPDAVLWMESELWPNLLTEVGRRHLPAALVNGRMSARSLRGWQRVPSIVRSLLGVFSIVLAQSDDDRARLAALGAATVACVGNLKLSALPQPGDAEIEGELSRAFAGRPTWLMASSHPGEEVLAFQAHSEIARDLPELLTVILPRHPLRGDEVVTAAQAAGLTVAQRSRGQLPQNRDAVYVADTMGEVGIFYRLISVVCMGGSFVPHGGQNPVEPVQLGAGVIYGPHMFNFTDITRRLERCGGAIALRDGRELAPMVHRLLTDVAVRQAVIAGAALVTAENRQIVDHVLGALAPVLNRAGIAIAPARGERGGEPAQSQGCQDFPVS